MAYFAVHYTYPDSPDDLARVRPEHRAFLRDLADQGTVVAAGAYPDPDEHGALLVLRAEDADAVARVLDADPFAQAGLIEQRRIVLWTPVIGILADS